MSQIEKNPLKILIRSAREKLVRTFQFRNEKLHFFFFFFFLQQLTKHLARSTPTPKENPKSSTKTLIFVKYKRQFC